MIYLSCGFGKCWDVKFLSRNTCGSCFRRNLRIERPIEAGLEALDK